MGGCSKQCAGTGHEDLRGAFLLQRDYLGNLILAAPFLYWYTVSVLAWFGTPALPFRLEVLESQGELMKLIRDAAKGIDDARRNLQGLGTAPLATDIQAALAPATCLLIRMFDVFQSW